MSAAITKITKDELNNMLEDWLCECATMEEEWDVIAEYSFDRKIKLVNKMYDGPATPSFGPVCGAGVGVSTVAFMARAMQ